MNFPSIPSSLLFAILVASLCIACNPKHSPSTQQAHEPSIRADSLITDAYRITWTVPTPADPAAQRAFQSWWQTRLEKVVELAAGANPYAEFTVDIDTVFEDANWVSYRLQTYWWEEGLAHGLPGYWTFNYSRALEKPLSFSEVFILPTVDDSLAFTELLEIHLGFTPYEGWEGVLPTPFNWEGDHVSFNFDPYTVAPYVAGMPQAVVSQQALAPFLAEALRKP